MPGFIEPCSPKIGAPPKPNQGQADSWAHEIKFDGYRLQAHIVRGRSRLYTRKGFDWTDQFQTVADDLAHSRVRSAIFDGEIVVPDMNGIPDFHLLENDLNAGRHDRMIYYVFDLLYLDGFDLRAAQLRHRRKVLDDLIGKGTDHVRLSEYLHPQASTMLDLACRLKLEGIVSKRLDAPYRSGEQSSWLKQKCKNSDTFPIVAFVEKLGAKPRRIASLYLGQWQGDQLLYAGKAQTGFKDEDLYSLREHLDPYIIPSSPLSVPVEKPKATWVEPVVLAEVEYSAFTSNGRLRAPVFKGRRADLATSSPRLSPARGPPQSSADHHTHRRRTVPRENILQRLPDAYAPPASVLKEYWKQVHTLALPHLARRPLKLVRSVGGITFYHKGSLPPIPPAVHQLRVAKREGGEGTRVWIDDLEGLLGLVDMDVIELHPWNALVNDIEHADVMVFDLDPGPGVSWRFVVDTASTLRELLEQHDLPHSWPKLTGGKGVHVMVPLTPALTHDAAHRQSRTIAEHLASIDPERYTVSATLSARTGRLFIDYLRNGRGTTAVGTYSPRARAPGTIAVPVEWCELEQSNLRPDQYTIDTALPTGASRARGQDQLTRQYRQSASDILRD